jgi:hypothetical protein
MIKPRGKTTRKGFSPGLTTYHRVNSWTLAAWCPDDKAEKPPTQVHLVLDIEGLPAEVLMRFKSPDTIGFMIEELYRYRKLVWPEAEAVNLDGVFPENKEEDNL